MGFNASALSANTIKTFVDRLNKRNKEKTTWPPKRSAVQEDIAKVLGYDSWHALNKALDTPKPDTKSVQQSTTPSHTPSLEKWEIPSDYHSRPISWDRVDWNKHCMVWGNDEIRSDFFAQLAEVNPSRPMALIQGPLALPVDNWKGASVKHTGHLGALMIGTLDFATISAQDIVDVFTIWNTSSNRRYSKDVLLMVCSALVQLRDAGKSTINVHTIMKHFQYEFLSPLAHNPDVSEATRHQIATYIENHHSGVLNSHQSIVSDWKTIQYIVDQFENSQNSNHRVLLHLKNHHDNKLQAQIEAYLDWWVTEHAGGLIVLDGLHSDSFLYEFLLRRLAVYKRDGVGVVFGCANFGDFPNSQMYEQIQGRMGRCFTL